MVAHKCQSKIVMFFIILATFSDIFSDFFSDLTGSSYFSTEYEDKKRKA